MKHLNEFLQSKKQVEVYSVFVVIIVYITDECLVPRLTNGQLGYVRTQHGSQQPASEHSSNAKHSDLGGSSAIQQISTIFEVENALVETTRPDEFIVLEHSCTCGARNPR